MSTNKIIFSKRLVGNESNFNIIEEHLKPLVESIRKYKKNYKLEEVYIEGVNFDKSFLDIVEKLTKVKILNV